ncbi:MAG: DUF2914 domain-containing protein [Bdellovibrionota bacterium]
MKWIDEFKQTLHKYKKWEPAVFFVAGFTFDAFLLHRIDDPLMLAHQAVYLTIAAFLIAWDHFFEAGRATIPAKLTKIWSYREGFLHFILGTLLNVYTIFYFKSGTILNSVVFLALLGGLLFLNEVRPTKIPKHALRNALFGLCLISYMNIIVPIVVGAIGVIVFSVAIAAASLIHVGYTGLLKSRLDSQTIWREIRLPFVGIAVLYSSLYFLKILPPVPLSMKHIGIYHEITKAEGTYRLGYTRPLWRFWESGDQTFEARPGDKIHCFVQVFSPTNFREQLFVRWQYKDERTGWTNSDAIPLSVVGGRAEGFRGFTVKENYQPGDWRVRVETSDGREVGRIGVRVITSHDAAPPEMIYEHR